MGANWDALYHEHGAQLLDEPPRQTWVVDLRTYSSFTVEARTREEAEALADEAIEAGSYEEEVDEIVVSGVHPALRQPPPPDYAARPLFQQPRPQAPR
jgi:hypothetical protein